LELSLNILFNRSSNLADTVIHTRVTIAQIGRHFDLTGVASVSSGAVTTEATGVVSARCAVVARRSVALILGINLT